MLKGTDFKTYLDKKLMAFFFGFGEKAKVLVVIVPHIANVGHAVGLSRGEANLIATLTFVGKQRQVGYVGGFLQVDPGSGRLGVAAPSSVDFDGSF